MLFWGHNFQKRFMTPLTNKFDSSNTDTKVNFNEFLIGPKNVFWGLGSR